MQRIGIIGTENSHAQHFIRLMNSEGRYPGVRVTALSGGRSDRNQELSQAGKIEVIVDEPRNLVGVVDAAIVCSRDGAQHRAQATPLLEAGIPVFVDKPFAASLEDGRSIVEAARSGGALVTTGSALRFAPEIPQLRAVEELRQLLIVGPGDVASPYSGLHFYGTHQVEAALEILGNPDLPEAGLDVHATVRDDTVTTSFQLGGVEVCLTFMVPFDGGQSPFHATAVGYRDTKAMELTVGPDYNEPPLQRFLRMIEEQREPVTEAEMLAPIAVLEAISRAVEAAKGVRK